MDDIILHHPFILIPIIVIVIIGLIGGCIYCLCCSDNNEYGKLNINTGEYDNDIPEVRISTSKTLDLHGMDANNAKSELEWFLERKEQERKWCNGSMTLTIITGKGNHSPHGHPVLKPVVKKYLENKGDTHNVDPQNTGRLFVQLL
ncbi:uncharacterized protein LOC124114850 [Haliotis rufescens]|uniref:uncharacterized protein LOC124114850 n=1 Tax=Haliotis rufescens TaxID=6454 RepID=UPI001EB07770|nr:uncharacterized protein LOC124114850 [Haliotis rufescens]